LGGIWVTDFGKLGGYAVSKAFLIETDISIAGFIIHKFYTIPLQSPLLLVLYNFTQLYIDVRLNLVSTILLHYIVVFFLLMVLCAA
jgi:hypothetical protein